MAFSGKKSGGKKKEIKKSGGKKRIEQYAHFGKFTLRAFPDGSGSPFFTGKLTEKEYFGAKHILDALSSTNEELLYRMGYGLSEAAAMVQLMTWLQDFIADVPKTGAVEFARMFEASKGRKALAAAEYLNMETDVARDTATAKEHVAALLDFFQTDPEKQMRTTRKVIMFSGRLYMAAIGAHKLFALANDPAKWAEKMGPAEEQPPEVKAWVRKPNDARKLAAALTASLRKHPKWTKQQKQLKKNCLSDSGEDSAEEALGSDADTSASESAGSGSSDSAAKKKKKSKKSVQKSAKKTKKRSSSSSASSSSAAKKGKKEKKPRKGKGKDARRPRGQDTPKPQKTAAFELSSDDGEDADAAAYVEWPQGRVQETAAQTATMEAAVGDSKISSLKALKDLIGGIPASVLALHGLENLPEQLGKRERAPKREQFVKVLAAVAGVCQAAETFYRDQQNAGALGGAAGGSSGPPAIPADAAKDQKGGEDDEKTAEAAKDKKGGEDDEKTVDGEDDDKEKTEG